MIKEIELVEGFFWPREGGKGCREVTIIRHETPQKISAHCKNKNVVISAGANVGFYIKKYAEIFKKVYAFEPEPVNFHCLDLNVKEENVLKIHGALGDKIEKVGLSKHCDDSGAWRVANGPRHPTDLPTQFSQEQDVQICRIDDLKLDDLDLIALDVEGFELKVLQGAVGTIKKHKPIISVEANFFTDACQFLCDINYIKIDEVNGDWVYKSNE